MRHEATEENSRDRAAEPVLLPFPSPPRRSSTPELALRECGRLLYQAHPDQLSFACARRWNQFRRWFHWVARPQTPHRAVFVIASPRTGSNLLNDFLCRLPGMGCLSEVLNWGLPIGPEKLQHPHQIVKHLRQSLQTLQTAQRSCKIFLHELQHYRLTIDDLDHAFPDARYLVLYRENLAEQFVSQQTAKQTGQWVLFQPHERKRASVEVDPRELTHYCHERRREYANIVANRAITAQGAIITYEELVANPARCLREIVCPLLGVPYVDVQTHLCKQSVEPLAHRVSNYSSVAELLNSPQCRLQIRPSITVPSHAESA